MLLSSARCSSVVKYISSFGADDSHIINGVVPLGTNNYKDVNSNKDNEF